MFLQFIIYYTFQRIFMKKLFTFLLLSLSIYVFAQFPDGYYTNANGKNTSTLRTTLQSIISNGHSVVTYDGLWIAYRTTDVNSSGKIWDMYSNCTFTLGVQQCGNYTNECDCFNREHTSPQSWFNSESPMVSDIFNVYPTDGKVNGERSNYPYGEVGIATYTSMNGSKLGNSDFADYTGIVFEPVDEYKGDFARTYFYMATRYAGLCESWVAGANVIYSTANLGLTTYAKNLFLKWSRQDPVSAKEILRNNATYAIQNNRNPFIDFPGLEEYIWGNKTTEVFTQTGTVTTYLGSPSAGSFIDFGKVSFKTTDTTSVLIKGSNLSGDLTLLLDGTNASLFSIPVLTLSKVDAETGYRLKISYSAQSLGIHTAQLNISGGGIQPTTVTLSGNSIDGFLALKAGDVTNNSFTANWSSSANATGYILDVFSLVGDGSAAPKTLLNEEFLNGLPTGWSTSGFTESVSGTIRFSSGANFGKITTKAIDLSSSPTVLTVKAKQYGNDAGAKLLALVNTDTIARWTTGVDNQDFSVNIPIKTSTSTISLYTYAGSGKRVYVDNLVLSTQGIAQMPVSVKGFPTSVGNVLNFSVDGLQSDSTYFYTVAPEGNNTLVSDQIPVHTLKLSSGVFNQNENQIIWSTFSNGVNVLNLPVNCNVNVYDIMGKQIQSFQNASSGIRINLSKKGIYILQVKQNQKLINYKIKF